MCDAVVWQLKLRSAYVCTIVRLHNRFSARSRHWREARKLSMRMQSTSISETYQAMNGIDLNRCTHTNFFILIFRFGCATLRCYVNCWVKYYCAVYCRCDSCDTIQSIKQLHIQHTPAVNPQLSVRFVANANGHPPYLITPYGWYRVRPTAEVFSDVTNTHMERRSKIA